MGVITFSRDKVCAISVPVAYVRFEGGQACRRIGPKDFPRTNIGYYCTLLLSVTTLLNII